MTDDTTYALIDCGDGRRLESFGAWLVDRPAPMATGRRRNPDRWSGATFYRRGGGWQGPDQTPLAGAGGRVTIAGATMDVRPSPSGNVGLFPEHAVNAAWLAAAVRARLTAGSQAGGAHGDGGRRPEVLNLFAYTGLGTIIAAQAGASVVHVDASRPSVAWARSNAALSGLGAHPVRWLVDDAFAFVRREARRDRRYAGVILDPPSHGHGAQGARVAWSLEDGVTDLLRACAEILEPEAFWLWTTHTPGWDPERMAATLAFGARRRPAEVEAADLRLSAESGAMLALGLAARLDPLRPDRR